MHQPALRAEWLKLRSLRSTWLTIAISVLAALILGAIASLANMQRWNEMSPAERAGLDPTSISLVGVLFGALVLGALGVRVIASEYGTGMIRTTAMAVPRRSRIVLSKAILLAAITLLVALTANVVGFLVGQAVFEREDLGASITEPASARAIALGALAVSAFAVIGVGLGTLVRRASIANILIALVVIGGQIIGTAMPSAAQKYLPFNALQATVTVHRGDELLAPLPALLMLVAYAVVLLAAAVIIMQRRDV
jgi:ABC-type transport system involved in multi-copper enzyme maturation permease subunit